MMVHSLLIVLGSILFAAMPEQSTIQFKLPGMVDEVTFDPAVISASELHKVMKLSPNVSRFNGYQVPESLELCKADDVRYYGCGTQNGPINLHNARLNLESIRQRVGDLSRNDYPAELAVVVNYLRTIQQFALWRGSTELKYLQTGDISLLELSFGPVNPQTSCAKELQNLRGAADRVAVSKLVRFDWSNCVWKAEIEQVGPYPKDVWQRFLTMHLIHEKTIEDSED